MCAMIDLESMYACEREFPSRFTPVRETAYGRLFCNPGNPLSNDSNHALILRLNGDLDWAIADIADFYRARCLTPRLYPAFLPDEWPTLRPHLEHHGFTCEEYEDHYFHWASPSSIVAAPEVSVERARGMDTSIAELLHSVQGSDRTVRVLYRHLRHEAFHLFVGRVAGKAVTLASFEVVGSCARVDNVMTHPAHRERGYCRALIHRMVLDYPSISLAPLYLWATDPAAMRIYREAGFVEFATHRPSWGAWQDQADDDTLST